MVLRRGSKKKRNRRKGPTIGLLYLKKKVGIMTPKLTAEQREALDRADGPVPVEDEKSDRVYFLVDSAMLKVMERQRDIEAIQAGIADMEAGRVAPLEDVMARIRSKP